MSDLPLFERELTRAEVEAWCEANGLAVVPDIPEDGMISAAVDYVLSTGGFTKCNWRFFGIYRAMLAAAKEGSDGY